MRSAAESSGGDVGGKLVHFDDNMSSHSDVDVVFEVPNLDTAGYFGFVSQVVSGSCRAVQGE
jgi:hypothetical protein